jgi:hypothetical protein
MKLSSQITKVRDLFYNSDENGWIIWARLPEVAKQMVNWAFISAKLTRSHEEFDVAISMAMSDEADKKRKRGK